MYAIIYPLKYGQMKVKGCFLKMDELSNITLALREELKVKIGGAESTFNLWFGDLSLIDLNERQPSRHLRKYESRYSPHVTYLFCARRSRRSSASLLISS